MVIISLRRFKIYKSDAAPFFFFIDIFPPDTSDPSYLHKEHFIALIKNIEFNPIMPLPMRIDRVYNGENSIFLRPRKSVSAQITEELTAFVNPLPFMQYGIEKLLYFTEIRGREKFSEPLSPERVKRWWSATRFLYGNLLSLEQDFSYFLEAYLETIVKAKITNNALIPAAKKYCQTISEICKKRIDENSILVEINAIKSDAHIYIKKDLILRKKFKKYKKTEVYPELLDLEVFDFSHLSPNSSNIIEEELLNNLKPKIMKYIPLLFYDDLNECMVDNLAKLEENEDQIIDPTFLIENNIIILEQSKTLDENILKTYSWWRDYKEIDLDSILDSIKTTLEETLFKIYGELHPKEDNWKMRLNSK